jgi:hypothetical protein
VTARLDAAELVDEAERHIAAGGGDPPFVLACALEALAEYWCDDGRPLCRGCNVRRVPEGKDLCGWCRDRQERLKMHKRATWARHGAQYKENARAAQALRDEHDE